MWHRPRTPPSWTVCYHVPSPWHGALSLPGCQHPPPHPHPQWWVLPCCNRDIAPPFFFPFFWVFFFVSLRFSLARRQCPFLGTFWKGVNTTTAYVFSLTFDPPQIIMDQCQLVNGYFWGDFFFFLHLLNSLLAFNTLKWGVHFQTKLASANSGWPGGQYFYCCCVKFIFAEGRGFSAVFPPHALHTEQPFSYRQLDNSLGQTIAGIPRTHQHAMEVLMSVYYSSQWKSSLTQFFIGYTEVGMHPKKATYRQHLSATSYHPPSDLSGIISTFKNLL